MKSISFLGAKDRYEEAETTPEGVVFRKGDHQLLVPTPAATIAAAKKAAALFMMGCEDNLVFTIAKAVVRAKPSALLEGALWANDEHILEIIIRERGESDIELLLRPDELWVLRALRPAQVNLCWRDLQFLLNNPFYLRASED